MKGKLDIVTTVDGQASQKTWEAECELGADFARIEYRDEQALVKVFLRGNKAEIERIGDYGLKMSFQEGKVTPVVLEIAGNVGEITAQTYRLGYLLSEKACLKFTTHYCS